MRWTPCQISPRRTGRRLRRWCAGQARRWRQSLNEGFGNALLHGTREIATAVEALTIKELADVASTLVSLSSFQQQMSLGRETVGGPVDVAVISKGDGLIWINRKHYFRKELNNHFFRNYYDDGATDGETEVGADDEEDEQNGRER